MVALNSHERQDEEREREREMRERVQQEEEGEAKNPLLAVSHETSTDARSLAMTQAARQAECSAVLFFFFYFFFFVLSSQRIAIARCVVFSRSIRFISSSHPSCDLWHPLFFFFLPAALQSAH